MKKLMLLFGVALLLISYDTRGDTIPYHTRLFIEVLSADGQNLLDTTNPNAFDLDSIFIVYPMHDGCMIEEKVCIVDLSKAYYYPAFYSDTHGGIKGIMTDVLPSAHRHYDSITDSYSYVYGQYDVYDYDNWVADDRTFYIKWNSKDIDTVVAFYKRTEMAYYRETPYKVLYNGKLATIPESNYPDSSQVLVVK